MHGNSCLGHLQFGLLQCALYGVALEDHPEIAASPECSSVQSNGVGARFAHVTLLLHKLYWLPVSFQVQYKELIVFKALYGQVNCVSAFP